MKFAMLTLLVMMQSVAAFADTVVVKGCSHGVIIQNDGKAYQSQFINGQVQKVVVGTDETNLSLDKVCHGLDRWKKAAEYVCNANNFIPSTPSDPTTFNSQLAFYGAFNSAYPAFTAWTPNLPAGTGYFGGTLGRFTVNPAPIGIINLGKITVQTCKSDYVLESIECCLF